MPSPVFHAAVGYALHRRLRARRAQRGERAGPLLPLLTTAAALLPDADFIPGVIAGRISRFHNQVTHSLFTGLVPATFAGVAARLLRQPFSRWAVPVLLAYQSHILLDILGSSSRGMMLLWPFSTRRFRFPLKLFYGVRWDRSLTSSSHLRTLATELTVLALIVILLRGLAHRR